MRTRIFLIAFAVISISACSSDDETFIKTNEIELPKVFEHFTENVTVYTEEIGGEAFVVIETDDIPNHNSPYFNEADSRNETYNGDNPNFMLNPNRIIEQNITFKIPINPKKASSSEATPLGAMGVSLNGVVFFNQYAGPNNQPLTSEIDSFDQFLGHPQQQGTYHYHQEPLYLTSSEGKDALLGWLLDGFPVYGPMEDGAAVTNADLDEYHGHEHATLDYPDGIYHYHITDADPYINGNGFYGVVGTVTN